METDGFALLCPEHQTAVDPAAIRACPDCRQLLADAIGAHAAPRPEYTLRYRCTVCGNTDESKVEARIDTRGDDGGGSA